MSDERKCKRCGEVIHQGERKCPKCGRLSLDSQTVRFGAESTHEPPHIGRPNDIDSEEGDEPRSSDASTQQKEAKTAASGEAKPDSFYAIAPEVAQPCPKCDGYLKSGKCKKCGYQRPKSDSKCGGCGPCMVFLIIFSWIVIFLSAI